MNHPHSVIYSLKFSVNYVGILIHGIHHKLCITVKFQNSLAVNTARNAAAATRNEKKSFEAAYFAIHAVKL